MPGTIKSAVFSCKRMLEFSSTSRIHYSNDSRCGTQLFDDKEGMARSGLRPPNTSPLFSAETFFTVFTDHSPLDWLLNLSAPPGRLIRWRLRLSKFDFGIQYRKGFKNCQGSAILRLQTNAKAKLSTTKLYIYTFAAPDVGGCDLIYFKFNASNNPFATHAVTNK